MVSRIKTKQMSIVVVAHAHDVQIQESAVLVLIVLADRVHQTSAKVQISSMEGNYACITVSF